MNRDTLDSLPRQQRTAVESAGYQVVRWSKARAVLSQRIAKQRWPGELSVLLSSKWAGDMPEIAAADGLRLKFGITENRLILQSGTALASLALERTLLHLPALRSFWSQELRRNHFDALRSLVAKAWITDTAAVPHGAVIHSLNTPGWPAPGTPNFHAHGDFLSESLWPETELAAIYHLNEKGRIVLRSIEALS